MPHGDVHETLQVNAHFAPVQMCTRLDRLSTVIAYGCTQRYPAIPSGKAIKRRCERGVSTNPAAGRGFSPARWLGKSSQ